MILCVEAAVLKAHGRIISNENSEKSGRLFLFYPLISDNKIK